GYLTMNLTCDLWREIAIFACGLQCGEAFSKSLDPATLVICGDKQWSIFISAPGFYFSDQLFKLARVLVIIREKYDPANSKCFKEFANLCWKAKAVKCHDEQLTKISNNL